MRERIMQPGPDPRREGVDRQQAGIQRGANCALIHIDADKDQFLPPIAPDMIPMLRDETLEAAILGPQMLGDAAPPAAHARGRGLGARQRQLAHQIGARGQPEMALGAHHPVEPLAGQKGVEQRGIERRRAR
jgi:hypothetical protein